MKAALLYFIGSFALAWSDHQSHYKTAKQKCVGEHQIMLKGPHSKHGFYIFSYMYSSSGPNNQTHMKKEDDDSKRISSDTHGSDKKSEARKHINNFNTTGQGLDGLQKHLRERGRGRMFEGGRTHERSPNLSTDHGNTSNWDLHQNPIEFIFDTEGPEMVTGDTTSELDGSGDMGFPGQIDTHHGITSGKKYVNQVKVHPGSRDTDINKLWKEDKDQLYSKINPSKHGYIKTRVKENDGGAVQETKPYIPKKTEDPKKKDDFNASLKVKIDSLHKTSGGHKEDYTDLLEKQKVDNATTKIHITLKTKSNISAELPPKMEVTGSGSNSTDVSYTRETKTGNENGTINIAVHRKGKVWYPLNGQEDRTEVSKPHKKSKVKEVVISRGQVEVVNFTKLSDKDGAKDDVTNGASNNHLPSSGVSKAHKKAETGISRKVISQLEDHVGIKTNEAEHSRGSLSVKSHRDKAGPIKSHPKSEVTIHGRILGSQISTPPASQQNRKSPSEDNIIHGTSHTGGSFSFNKAPHKEVDDHEKLIRNAHGSTPGDPERHEKDKNRFSVRFQEVSKGTVKGVIGFRKSSEVTSNTKKKRLDSSSQKVKHSSQKSVQLKTALPLSHRSHDTIQHEPKKDNLKGQEHPLSTVRSHRKVVKVTKQQPGAHPEPYGHKRATYRRSHHHKKHHHHSSKKAHGHDSSQSSESDENSRHSYEDYQKDQPDSHQSTETEEDWSAESHEKDDPKSTSKEDP